MVFRLTGPGQEKRTAAVRVAPDPIGKAGDVIRLAAV